jgi:NAD(P)H-dependent FMN reductase
MPGPIMIISGTNRPGSNSDRLAAAIGEMYAAAGHAAAVYRLADLPAEVFAPTVYAHKPPAFVEVQKKVVDAAGLHVVVPEYNGSFPGILKYFIDLLKFPESFDRKPVAFVGLGSGSFAGVRPVEQLQMVFAYRNAHLFPDRVFIPGVRDKFDAGGRLTDADLIARLERQTRGFADFAGRL